MTKVRHKLTAAPTREVPAVVRAFHKVLVTQTRPMLYSTLPSAPVRAAVARGLTTAATPKLQWAASRCCPIVDPSHTRVLL